MPICSSEIPSTTRCYFGVTDAKRQNPDCSQGITHLETDGHAGCHAAWLFRAKDPVSWANQLQMPLIQYALAKTAFGAPLSEVSLGIVSFEERLVVIEPIPRKKFAWRNKC